MPTDNYEHVQQSIHGPYKNILSITAHDDNDLSNVTAGLMCGVSGNIAVITQGGQTVTFPAVAGYFYPVRITRVKATGTTATGIIGLY